MTELCTPTVTTRTGATGNGINAHSWAVSAPAGGLQQAKPLADVLFGLLIALPLIFELEPRPPIRVEGLQLKPAERAVGCGWRGQQGRIGPANCGLLRRGDLCRFGGRAGRAG